MAEVNNITNIAREIVSKLDKEDEKDVKNPEDRKGDGKIQASIWNEFVSDKQGNKIRYSINKDNALKSVITYLKREAAKTGRAIEDIANEWLGKLGVNQDNVDKTQTQSFQKDEISSSYGEIKSDEFGDVLNLSLKKMPNGPLTLDCTLENKNKLRRASLPADTTAIKMNGITHYAFNDCPINDRVKLNNGITVHKSVLAPLKAMQEAAKKDGVDLTVVSGFRSTEQQKRVFSKKFASNSNPSDKAFTSRLKESAPPGFSEHHTGLAIDLCSVEESDFEPGGRFEKAGKWLKEHAAEYGFEQSFPENNSQGLINEPWHYRYVGNENAEKIFAEVHKANTNDNLASL